MKYIGLDLGSVTCGVSRSETGLIAQAVKTIRFRPDDYDEVIDRILELLKEKSPVLSSWAIPCWKTTTKGPEPDCQGRSARSSRTNQG